MGRKRGILGAIFDRKAIVTIEKDSHLFTVTPSEVGISVGVTDSLLTSSGSGGLTWTIDPCSASVTTYSAPPEIKYPKTEEELVADERRRTIALNLAIRSFPPDFILKQSDTVVFRETAKEYEEYLRGPDRPPTSMPVSEAPQLEDFALSGKAIASMGGTAGMTTTSENDPVTRDTIYKIFDASGNLIEERRQDGLGNSTTITTGAA